MTRRPTRDPFERCGKFSHRDTARAALLAALLRSPHPWGEPLAERWGADRKIALPGVLSLLGELVAGGHVLVVASDAARHCLRWQARRPL